MVRNEFRQVERLRGMKCFLGSETQFALSVSLIRFVAVQFPNVFDSYACSQGHPLH